MHSLTQFGYFSCSIHQVIWYLTSENPEICWKSLEVTSRKNGRFLELAQIGPFLMHGSFKHLICQPKKCIIHEKLDQQLLLNHIIFICYPYNQYLTRLLYQIMFFSKIHPAENGSTRAIPENLPFFLDVTSKLFQHISGFSDVKYQMTWCMEHEKYPNCVRLSTVVSVIDDLLVTVDRNTLYLEISNML